LLDVSSRADKIRKHYEQFPDHPAAFDKWVNEVRPLWAAG
jgi:hypothetical protein